MEDKHSRSVSRSNSISRSRSRTPVSHHRSHSRSISSRSRSPSYEKKEKSHSESHNSPVFIGNLPSYVKYAEVENLFSKYGEVEKLELKVGFGFVTMTDPRDSEKVISELDGTRYNGNTLRLQWASSDGTIKQREAERQKIAQSKPNTTLFIVGFDATRTREDDLLQVFKEWSKDIVRCDIRKNYAFVEFKNLDDATKAREATNGMKMLYQEGHVLTVEYVVGEKKESRGPPYRRGGGRFGDRDRFDRYNDRYNDRYDRRGPPRFNRYDRDDRYRDRRDYRDSYYDRDRYSYREKRYDSYDRRRY